MKRVISLPLHTRDMIDPRAIFLGGVYAKNESDEYLVETTTGIDGDAHHICEPACPNRRGTARGSCQYRHCYQL